MFKLLFLFCIVAAIVLIIVIGLIKLDEEQSDKVFPSGYTIRKAKRYLENNTHCGKYWNIKATYNRKNKSVEVYMEGNERVTLYLETGEIERIDLD